MRNQCETLYTRVQQLNQLYNIFLKTLKIDNPES